MRLRLSMAAAILLFTTGSALASTPDYGGDGSSGFAWGSTSGLLAAGGAAALVGGLAELFTNHSSGVHADAVSASPAAAPEISSTGTASGLVLVLGGALVASGRRRKLATVKG